MVLQGLQVEGIGVGYSPSTRALLKSPQPAEKWLKLGLLSSTSRTTFVEIHICIKSNLAYHHQEKWGAEDKCSHRLHFRFSGNPIRDFLKIWFLILWKSDKEQLYKVTDHVTYSWWWPGRGRGRDYVIDYCSFLWKCNPPVFSNGNIILTLPLLHLM